MKDDASVSVAVNLNTGNAGKELQRLEQKVLKLQEDLTVGKSKKGALTAELEQAQKALAALQAQTKIENGKAIISPENVTKISAMREKITSLQAAIEKQNQALKNTQMELDGVTRRYGEVSQEAFGLGKQAGGLAERLEQASKKVADSMNKFSSRIAGLFKRVLVFSLITKALTGFRSWLGDVIKSNGEAVNAIANLKGALLTLAQPISSVLIPVFTAFLRILTQIVSAIASFVSLLFGKTLSESKKAAENMNEEAKAIGGVGGAAKKATKQLAAFDEINRLVKETASGGGSSGISASFNFGEVGLPNWLKNLTADLALKINSLKLDWNKGNILKNKDAWIIGLSAILGAILGSMFGGLSGGIIGLVLGAAIGLVGCTLLDKTDNPEKYKKIAIVALAGIIGAVLGGKFGGIAGSVIGLLMGLSIGLIALDFTEGKFEKWKASDTFLTVLSAIVGAALGGVFGGIKGAVLGLVLGATIGIKFLNWANDLENPGEAKGEFQIVLAALLGMVVGSIFGGVAGGIVGLVLGLAIGVVSVQFNDDVDAATKKNAITALNILLTALIGALIGAALGGPVGAIVGGVVGVTLGLAVHWSGVTMDDVKIGGTTVKGGHSHTSGKAYSAIPQSLRFSNIPSVKRVELPRLATGAVIPPNREFMAVLGDQTSGNNIEAPESLIRKIVREETGGSRRLEALLETLIDITREGKTLELDGVAFAKVAKRSLNNNARAYGVPIMG